MDPMTIKMIAKIFMGMYDLLEEELTWNKWWGSEDGPLKGMFVHPVFPLTLPRNRMAKMRDPFGRLYIVVGTSKGPVMVYQTIAGKNDDFKVLSHANVLKIFPGIELELTVSTLCMILGFHDAQLSLSQLIDQEIDELH